jgi:hypothetical protein
MREGEGRQDNRTWRSESRRGGGSEGEYGAFGYERPDYDEYSGPEYGSRGQQGGFGRQQDYGWGDAARRGYRSEGYGSRGAGERGDQGRGFEGSERWRGTGGSGWGLGGEWGEGLGIGESRYGEQSRFGGPSRPGGQGYSRSSYYDQGPEYASGTERGGMEQGGFSGMGSRSTSWGAGQGEGHGQQRGGPISRGGQGIQQGTFSGRGPQGYRRSDERILEDIYEALTIDPNIDATNITAEVKSGEVTLKGTVTDRNAKRLAEELAEQCSGVKDVQNQIRVRREEESDTESRHERSDEGKRGGKSAA